MAMRTALTLVFACGCLVVGPHAAFSTSSLNARDEGTSCLSRFPASLRMVFGRELTSETSVEAQGDLGAAEAFAEGSGHDMVEWRCWTFRAGASPWVLWLGTAESDGLVRVSTDTRFLPRGARCASSVARPPTVLYPLALRMKMSELEAIVGRMEPAGGHRYVRTCRRERPMTDSELVDFRARDGATILESETLRAVEESGRVILLEYVLGQSD